MHPDEQALNELVDGTLESAERADVERHLENCAECRTIVDGLREIGRAIGSLALREPPVRTWSRVERAIRLDIEARADGAAGSVQPGGDNRGARDVEPRAQSAAAGVQSGDGERRHGFAHLKTSRAVWLGLAAAAVVVVAASLTLRLAPSRSGRGPVPQAASQTDPGSDAQSVEAELRQASEHYEKAIKGLEQIANAEQGALDPGTAATLQKNLAVIDQAITESRAALHTQPNSEPAQQSLIDNFKTKIALLQDTVALINEMRKGNEAGAARIVSGLKQKG
jgi:anti-sigma factor RsiW